jgi:NADH pyrophosphatase NudC (nudix superfamily)
MLGFRRKNQVRNIAHGCASTLLRIGKLEREKGRDSIEAWGINSDALPACEHREFPRSKPAWKSIQRKDGQCWLNHDTQCPFSKQALSGKLEKNRTVEEVARIYESCQSCEAHFGQHA